MVLTSPFLLSSTLRKRDLEVDFMDNASFVNLSFEYMLDTYALMGLNIMMIFYPFRIFSFISRFKSSSQISGVLSTIVRMFPGICTFITIAIIASTAFSVSAMLLFGPYVPSMSSFLGAFFVLSSQNLFDVPEVRDELVSGLEQANHLHFPIFAVFINSVSKFGTVIFIALTVYLFGKAFVLEKALQDENEDEHQAETIEEIHEKVNQILSLNKQAYGVMAGETHSLNKRTST